MKRFALALWLLLPVGGLGYHFGPGQDRLRLDDAARLSDAAYTAAQEARFTAESRGDDAARPLWAKAEAAFAETLAAMPQDCVHDARVLRLERAKAQLNASKLPAAREALLQLVRELEKDGSDKALLADARDTLGNAQYFTTWLMRLEGEPRDVWETEIEGARQNFRMLAERAEQEGRTDAAAQATESLESALRLARMDLTELQGLPLPSV